MTLAQTTSALDSVAFIAVVLSVALVVTRSLNRMVWLVALQAVVVSLAPLLIGLALGEAHLIVAAALSVAIRGVAIPLALGGIVRRSNVRVELHPYLGRGPRPPSPSSSCSWRHRLRSRSRRVPRWPQRSCWPRLSR